LDIFTPPKRSPAIAVAGCYSITSSEYLNIDADAEYIDSLMEKAFSEIQRRHIAYTEQHIPVEYFIPPSFLPPLLGVKGLNKFFRWKIKKHHFAAVLYIFRNIGKQNFQVIILSREDIFTNTSPFDKLGKDFSSISNDSQVNIATVAEASVMFYALISGQLLLDALLEEKQYSLIHTIITDSKVLLNKTFTDINFSETTQTVKRISRMRNFWTSSFDRFQAITLLEQKEYYGALKSILNAIKISPYYPFDSYEEYKLHTTQEYIISISHIIHDNNDFFKGLDIGTSIDKLELQRQIETIARGLEVRNFKTNIEIAVDIIMVAQNTEVFLFLEQNFDKFIGKDINDALFGLYKYELFKFIPKGEAKVNELYVERIPECKEYLLASIASDPGFLIIYLKLGMLYFFEASEYPDRTEQGFSQMAEYIKQGIHIYASLGLSINDFKSNSN
jgi:hypothetical protein